MINSTCLSAQAQMSQKWCWHSERLFNFRSSECISDMNCCPVLWSCFHRWAWARLHSPSASLRTRTSFGRGGDPSWWLHLWLPWDTGNAKSRHGPSWLDTFYFAFNALGMQVHNTHQLAFAHSWGLAMQGLNSNARLNICSLLFNLACYIFDDNRTLHTFCLLLQLY